MAKIIDWTKKGNVVRFYLGADDCVDYWGDDWNDLPYEHNAGTVYPEFIVGICDKAFPYDWDVCEPADDWTYGGNSPFCKDDFKNRKAPFLVAAPHDNDSYLDPQYSKMALDENVEKYFFGDEMEATEPFDISKYVG